MNLPNEFLEELKQILTDKAYKDYLESFEKENKKSLLVNRKKISRDELMKKLPEEFGANPNEFVEAININKDSRPGKIPEYYTGLFYPQEPSAMLPALLAQPKEGELILDLCASPGGKSIALAQEDISLVSNEITSFRAQILASNLERMGLDNVVILNEFPENLIHNFKGTFDKILLDAPCSGEGMFRKDERVISEWSKDRVKQSVKTQESLLKIADQLLKEDGEIIYSTCTLNTKENEEQIKNFLETHDYELIPLEIENLKKDKLKEGIVPDEIIEKTIRIMPQDNLGEGHFIAKLKKKNNPGKKERNKNNFLIKKAKNRDLKDYLDFKETYLLKDYQNLIIFNKKLWALPKNIYPDQLTGLKVKKPGLLIGEFKKNRFEPDQSLAMNLEPEEFKNNYYLTEDELWSYLKGEEIKPIEKPKSGWVLMIYENFPVGFSKMSGPLKNRYPRGLRIYKK